MPCLFFYNTFFFISN